jgi:prepilin-type N-terminal cleavage/methylation domain-containing protein
MIIEYFFTSDVIPSIVEGSDKQTTNRKAFTLIELVVAIGILAMILSFSSVIFRVSINSQRTAVANAEIMQKLRAITDQINADFKSIATGYGGYIGFNTDKYTVGSTVTNINSDCITFFTNGDFQSTAQYTGKTISGNVACIFYSPADPNSFVRSVKPRNKILLRRQTILTADAPAAGSDPRGEYYNKTLSQWRVEPPFPSRQDWVKRPHIDPENLKEQFVMYLAKGADNFTIQFAERDSSGKIRWNRHEDGGPGDIATNALKFTFTLYDSNGIIRNGRTFTHIVYLGG